MNKRILLGVDATMSPPTQLALHKVGELIGQAIPMFRVVLLHVIPIPYTTSPSLGMYVGSLQPGLVTAEQRTQAENVLRKAGQELQKLGLAREQIDAAMRIGTPADEIARVARELQVDFVVVGSRGSALRHKLRRFFVGSTSRKVLQLAPCPVMIVVPPPTQAAAPTDLVRWYEEAVTRYLREHTSGLTVFTPGEVVQLFAPPNKKSIGRKETAAAILALEHLASNGVLCRHDVKGEMRYVND